MYRRPCWTLSLLLCSLAAAEEPASGPRVGATVPELKVVARIVEDRTERVLPLEERKDQPVLVIFVRDMTRPGFGLLQTADKYAALRQPEGLETVIVLTKGEVAERLAYARLLGEKYQIQGTRYVADDGLPAYGLHDEAPLTILLIGKDRKVLANLARRAPDQRDFAELRTAIDKLLGPAPVKFP